MPRRRKPVDRTVLDRFGRVLLPKPLRDRAGIRPGDALRVAVRSGNLVLEPVRGDAGIALRDGLPVLTGYALSEEFDWTSLVRRDRERRVRDILDRGRGA
jgi:AbrB family looped-hinge helix DNA binding protein